MAISLFKELYIENGDFFNPLPLSGRFLKIYVEANFKLHDGVSLVQVKEAIF